jgi:hypothetical protein
LNFSCYLKADSENPSLLQQVGGEINSTMAGRVVSNMAKMATNKMTELLGKNSHLIFLFFLVLDFFFIHSIVI